MPTSNKTERYVMRKIISLLVIFSIVGIQPAESATKTIKCSSGTVKVKSGNTYKCIKKVTAPVIKAQVFTDVCERDNNVPQEWAEYQEFALRTFGCARPYRFVTKTLPNIKPKNETVNDQRVSAEVCKIKHGPRSGQIAFADFWDYKIDLSKEVNIQIIPIEFSDFPSNASPEKDYGKYFKYIKDAYYNLSDGRVKMNVSVPDNYFKLNKTAKSYSTGKTFQVHPGTIWEWVDMDMFRLVGDITSTVDPSIDFSNTTLNILVVPPTTNESYIAHRWTPDVYSSEKTIKSNYFIPPNSMINRKSWNGVEPFLHVHELQHAMNKADDHQGDTEEDVYTQNAGTGSWGIMSRLLTDFLVWDKWITNMIDDSQVICVDPNKNSTNWIKPASYFGQYEKMIVVPISPTNVLVMESVRSAGFNFKLPAKQQGVLVYAVDTTNTKHMHGIDVLRTYEDSRGPNRDGEFFLWNAPITVGEKITYKNYEISVTESGEFGDVVSVKVIK